MKIKTKKAFTLMEVMITVVIIGVIAALALPQYSKTVEASHRTDAETQLIALHGADYIYKAQNSSFFVGSGLTYAAINSGLNINIIPNAKTYSYTGTATTFAASAVRAGSLGTFTITIDQTSVVPGTNPSCADGGTGACP